ncbi:MAG: TIGR01777 family oxidoreductase [Bacteroidota bacterium]
MPRFTARSPVPVSAAELFTWHERPGAFARLAPPWQDVSLEHFDGIRPGDRAVIRLGLGPAAIRWTAEHSGYDDSCRTSGGGPALCGFHDVQVSGPFASWEHAHRMIPEGPDASTLEDDVRYELPLAPVSSFAKGIASGQLERMFGYRHRVTREDLARHATWDGEPWTIAVTGSSGLIGEALCAFLGGGGHRVVRLVRSQEAVERWDRNEAERALYWNVDAGEIDAAGLAALAPDAVIHLAGEPVFGFPWNEAKKRAIWESRTKGTMLLARALAALPTPPKVFLSASASGIYGDTGDQPVTEQSALGEGFLSDVCRAWEAATDDAEAAGIRTAHLRIGLVLSPAGGMLAKLGPATQIGLGAWPGDGSAFWSWIALDDVLYAIHHLLQSDLSGPVNFSAPAPSTAKATVKALGRTLRRPTLASLPRPLLSLAGEPARELGLKSVRMMPERLRQSGFRYAYPTLDAAFSHLYGTESAR